ncbi:hypothetical protein EGI11_10260 [Chryseobacterium sp. H3056]|uniref:Uncharacterized protein n=1 Tax=Kaistella daneshvariae TaxID=2487074 RepID=A0A3N0WSL1_9FLAO|nr:hypothetical protein [Kaistella daneshvariae]ROI08032.1 hypothetical protein EGI11_10260 [Kaistella daneshvariae]
MKNLFFILMIGAFAVLSCRNEDENIQRIDQIIQLYIDSAGQDMLNSKIPGSYTDIKINDVYGLTDTAPVSLSLKKDADTVTYLEYVAAAKRITIDSTATFQTYESKLALQLTKKVNDSTNLVTNDTMKIQYQSTPEIFQVSKIWYNNELKFTKTDQLLNVVKISK